MLTKTCAVAGCDRTSELPEMSFFSFPKNKTVFYQWIRFISEPITHDLANKYICSAHFPDEDFFDDNREHLRDNAVPSLFDEETISLMKENHCSLINDIEVYKDDIHDNYIKEEDVQYIKEEEVEFVEDSILEIEIEAETSSCDDCNSNNIESSDVVLDPTEKNIRNEHDFQNTIVEIDGSGLIDENTLVEIVTDDAMNKTVLTKQKQFFSKKNIKEPDSNKEIIRLSSCQDSTTCDLCRLCTKQIEDDKIHIFSQDETSVQLIEMVKVIMPGKVNENDGLPNSICMPCLHKLKECYDLTMMFLTADAYFRNKEFITLPRPIEQKGNHYQKTPEELNENATLEKNNSNHVLFIKNPEDLEKDMALNHNLTSINENSSNNTSENESNSNTLVTASSDKHLCSSCHDTFNSSVELTLHKYTMHKSAKANGLYNCPICPLVFSMLQALKLHVQQRHSKICKLYKCGDCKVVFRTQQLLDNHKKKIHKKYDCEICGKKFSYLIALKRHMHRHSINNEESLDEEKPYSCWICGKTYRLEGNLNNHIQNHFGVQTQDYPCLVCGRRLPSISELYDHIQSHKDKEKHYKCSKCNKTYVTKSLLQQHRLFHSTEKLYMCEVCGKAFKKSSTLHRHRESHRYIKEEPNIVDQTNNFPDTQVESKVYECEVCGKNLLSSLSYKYHLSRHTGNKKPFDCEICGMTFAKVHGYRTHILIHKGEYPFVCEKCGKGFRTKRTLQQHEVVHTDERPYSCNSCHLAFKRMDSLYMHQAVHSGKRPFSCTMCAKTFVRKQDTRTHLIRYHKMHNSEVDLYILKEVEGETYDYEVEGIYDEEEYFTEYVAIENSLEVETSITS